MSTPPAAVRAIVDMGPADGKDHMENLAHGALMEHFVGTNLTKENHGKWAAIALVNLCGGDEDAVALVAHAFGKSVKTIAHHLPENHPVNQRQLRGRQRRQRQQQPREEMLQAQQQQLPAQQRQEEPRGEPHHQQPREESQPGRAKTTAVYSAISFVVVLVAILVFFFFSNDNNEVYQVVKRATTNRNLVGTTTRAAHHSLPGNSHFEPGPEGASAVTAARMRKLQEELQVAQQKQASAEQELRVAQQKQASAEQELRVAQQKQASATEEVSAKIVAMEDQIAKVKADHSPRIAGGPAQGEEEGDGTPHEGDGVGD